MSEDLERWENEGGSVVKTYVGGKVEKLLVKLDRNCHRLPIVLDPNMPKDSIVITNLNISVDVDVNKIAEEIHWQFYNGS